MGMGRLVVFWVSVFYILTSPQLLANADLYDDFSGSGLDESKWAVSVGTGGGYFDEYGPSVSEGTYHTSQMSGSDKSVRLDVRKEILEGDSIEYDVHYISSSGNVISRLWFDGKAMDLICRDQGYGNNLATTCDIGYWNGESEVGNGLGTYHVSVGFLGGGFVSVVIERPDGTNWSHQTSSPVGSSPHTFGVETRTGHNGISHVDYDNFIFGKVEGVPTESEQNESDGESDVVSEPILDDENETEESDADLIENHTKNTTENNEIEKSPINDSNEDASVRDIPDANACNGCASGESCLPFGTRFSINDTSSYCHITKVLEIQKVEGEICQNSYECLSNTCSNGVCVDIQKELREQRNLIESIIDWLKNLFSVFGNKQ